jgi:hypothetical protein
MQTKRPPVFTSKYAQASVEYLIVIAVIVAASLLSVIVFTGLLDTGVNSPQLAQVKYKQTISSQTLGLSEAMVDSNGDALLVLTNNTDYPLLLIGYNVDENETNLSQSISFNPREKKTLFFANIGPCQGQDYCVYKQIIFRYALGDSVKVLNSGATDYVLAKVNDVLPQ